MTNDSGWLPQIDPARCVGSGDCVSACPTGALGLVGGKAALVNPSACIYCADCETLCRSGAISLPYQIVLGDEPATLPSPHADGATKTP